MIVECPRCNARYRVDEDVVADEPTFKCSRCSHFFGQEAAAAVKAAKQAATAPAAEEDEETPLEPDEEIGPTAIGDVDDADMPDDPEPATAAAAPPPEPPPPLEPPPRRTSARPARPEPESLSLPFSTVSKRPSEPPEPVKPPVADDDDFSLDSDDDGEEEFSIGSDSEASSDSPAPDSRPRFLRDAADPLVARQADGVRRPYLIFLGVVLLVFGNLALYLRNHPESAERFLASIPFAGRILVENRLLQSRVYLRDVEGVYQQIKDGRTVFIVTGRAINTADSPLRGIEIESALYDAAGAALMTKSIYCGNAMSLKIVKDLSSKEISILQRLQPPQRFEIPPGESTGFSVVFLDPPQGFKEFSARVTSAQPVLS